MFGKLSRDALLWCLEKREREIDKLNDMVRELIIDNEILREKVRRLGGALDDGK